MKAIVVLAVALMTGLSAFAYEYSYQEGVTYRSGDVAYKCWTIKAWDVSASDLREYSGQVNSSLADSCQSATGRRCQQMNGSISCKTSDDCSRTFRSCVKK